MRYLFLLLSVLIAWTASAEGPTEPQIESQVDLLPQSQTEPEPPDNDAIFGETINAASPYYYPTLFARYQNGDTTLTTNDYRHLYYGYAWRPEYKPFETSSARDKILGVFSSSDSLHRDDYLKIIEYGKQLLKREPFDPSTLNFMTYAYGALGDTHYESIYAHHLKGILEAILSTGTGLKESSPWHILYFSHAKDLLNSMDIIAGRERVISRTVAYMPLLVKIKGVKGYYFDFGRVYWHRPDNLPEKRSNGWMFNGVPLKKRVAPSVKTVD